MHKKIKCFQYLKVDFDITSDKLGMFKINDVYYYQVIVKYRKDDNLIKSLKFIDDMYKKNSKVDIMIDFNPSKI